MPNRINFTPFPELKNERIILRKLTTDDANDFSKLRSDISVNEFLNRPDHMSVGEADIKILKLNSGIGNNEWIFWAITQIGKETELIGTICLWNLDKELMLAEIGFELLPEFQGKGIMSEAIDLVLNYGGGKMGVKRFEGFTNKNNAKSFKLLEKFGFIRDEEIEQDIISDDPDFINMVAYKLEK